MDPYFDAYNRVVKFAAEGEEKPSTDPDLELLLRDLNVRHQDRFGGSHADHNFRLAVADKLKDHGREVESRHLQEGHSVKVKDGKVVPDYPSHAWPGGIPIVYYCGRPPRDHGTGARLLCADCITNLAHQRAEALAAGEEPDVQSPTLYHQEGHEEGAPIECDDCNNQIEAAYGDPENPDDGY